MNKIKFSGSILLAALLACTGKPAPEQKQVAVQNNPVTPEKAQIFVTARDTTLRLSETRDLTFEDFKQPLETQVCIFLDPSHTFQTFIGIGGALTDASA